MDSESLMNIAYPESVFAARLAEGGDEEEAGHGEEGISKIGTEPLAEGGNWTVRGLD
jgi:hypothetical protein